MLDKRLQGREFIAGEYSIADMACYPRMSNHERQQIHIDEFAEVKRWLGTIRARPATKRAYRSQFRSTLVTAHDDDRHVVAARLRGRADQGPGRAERDRLPDL